LRQSIQQQQQHRTVSDTSASVNGASINTSANNSSFPSQKTGSTATADNPLSKDEEGAIGAEVVQAPGTYYFGIIDILQEWNFAKKLERFYKVYIRFNAAGGISAVPPDNYQKRFMSRVANDIFDFGDPAAVVGSDGDSRWSASPHNRNFSSGIYSQATSVVSARTSLRRKSRGTEDASICVLAESPRVSDVFADDMDYAEYAY